MSHSIFGSLAMKRVPDDEVTRTAVVTTPPPAVRAAPPATADAALLAILGAPLAAGESAHVGFARKEAELGAAFAALGILESRALCARLSNPRPGDALAEAFMRLTVDRRTRLINFLADARRRAALAQANR
jgi:hypothetical protein